MKNIKIFFSKKSILVVFLVLFQLLFFQIIYRNLKNYIYFDDSLELAQTARNLLTGKGFTLKTYTYQGLDKLNKVTIQSGNWPNFQRFPLPVLILSGLFKIFGQSDQVITFFSVCFYFLIFPAVVLLAESFNFGLVTAIVAGLILITNPLVLNSSLIGQPEIAGMILFSLFLGLFLRRSGHKYFLIGLVAALAYLNRFESILWIIIFLFWFFVRNEKKNESFKNFKKVILVFVIFCLPWWIYVFSKTGNPFFSLQGAIGIPSGTITYPNALYAELEYIDPLKFVFTHPAEIFFKFIRYGRFFWQRFLVVGSISHHLFLLFLFWLLKKQSEEEETIKKPLILSFLSVSLASIFFTPEPRYLLFFFPVIILLGTRSFFQLIERFKKNNLIFYLLLISFFVVLNTKSFFKFISDIQENNYYRYEKQELADLKKVFDGNSVLISNLPRLTGWYGDRKSLYLPKSPQDIDFIEKKYVKIDGIFLISSNLHPLLPVWRAGWEKILLDKPEKINNYYLKAVFESGSLLYLKKE